MEFSIKNRILQKLLQRQLKHEKTYKYVYDLINVTWTKYNFFNDLVKVFFYFEKRFAYIRYVASKKKLARFAFFL